MTALDCTWINILYYKTDWKLLYLVLIHTKGIKGLGVFLLIELIVYSLATFSEVDNGGIMFFKPKKKLANWFD